MALEASLRYVGDGDGVGSPGDAVSVELEELEEFMGFLPVSGLLLGGQRVVGHEQRMTPAS